MHIEPSEAAFAERYAAGAPQVVWTTLVADLETPVSAFLKIAGARAGGAPMSFLLESVEGGEVRGRYSIIGLEPDLIFRAIGRRAAINRAPQSDPDAFAPTPQPPLEAMRALHRRKPHRAAGRAAADGGRRVRLSRLRHGAADGGYAGGAGPDPIGIPDANSDPSRPSSSPSTR